MVNPINELDADMLRIKCGLDCLEAKVVIANEDHVIVYANHSAMNFLNNAEDEIRKDFPHFSVGGLIGKKIEQFHKKPIYQKELIRNLQESLLTNIVVGNLMLSIKATPIFNDRKQRIGFMAEMDDITDRERKKVELLKANERNRLLNNQVNQMQRVESISRLTAGISHDFNNILAVIVGYNDLNRYIADEYQNEALKDELLFNLNQIEIASERGRVLINKMMVYSRQNVNHKEIDIKATNDVIQEVLALMRPALTSTFDISAHVDTLLDIQIDSTELLQTLTNLIVNARDAMEQRGHITISLKQVTVNDLVCNACVHKLDGEFIELSVADNGTGIEESIITHIFDPFFTTKEVGEGTGLGLATVSGMVHEANGHIVIESKTTEPDRGTVFRLLFPTVNVA